MSFKELSELFQRPINSLPFSEVFKLRSKLMGFYTLQDIIDTQKKVLFKKEDFNYIWLNELLDFLNKRNLLYILDRLR
jgi:hypothetical protein